MINRQSDQMITAGADSLIRIWNLNDPSQLPVEIDDFSGLVSSMAYGQDGRSFFAATLSGISPLREMPAQASYIAEGLCGVLSRNFTSDEWLRYVGSDIPYEETCGQGDLRIRVREIRGE
jgi:WD40 repeat protein